MGLDIDKAFLEMMKGNKISHKALDENLFYLDNNLVIRDKKGYNCEDWWVIRRNEKRYKEGWYIVE